MHEEPTKVLVTGAAGYIGSHAALRLVEGGFEVVGYDDFSRGHRGAIEALATMSNDAPGDFRFVEGSISDREGLAEVMRAHGIEAVLHFAAFAYVGESVEQPLRYYDNNTGGACRLLEAVEAAAPEEPPWRSTVGVAGMLLGAAMSGVAMALVRPSPRSVHLAAHGSGVAAIAMNGLPSMGSPPW